MRTKFTFLLIVLGGVIAAVLRPNIPPLVVSTVGGFGLGFGLMFYSAVYSAKVWGIKIKYPVGKTMLFVLIGIVGLIAGGFSLVYTVLVAFTSLLSANIISAVVNIVAFVITVCISPMIAHKILENSMAKSTHAMVLEQFDLFKEIEANMGEATNFVVGFEGVALYSSTNYCYAVYFYENYGLGELTEVSEVAMVGSYFVQKYHDRFTFKVDEEVIPGEPGRTVVAVGAGGVSVGRVSGTPDKRLFRSYIFTRKK